MTGTTAIEVLKRPVVPAMVCGSRSVRLILETGGVGCSVSDAVVSDLELSIRSDGTVILPEISIGQACWKDIRWGVRRPWGNTDGQIGLGFMVDFVVSVDYPGKTASFCPRDERKEETADTIVLMEVRNYFGLLPTYVNGAGPFSFFLDTGADNVVVAPDIAGRLGLEKGEEGVSRGVLGDTPMHQTTLKSISVGDATVADLRVIVMDCGKASEYVGKKVDGYIGTSFLRNFKVDLDFTGERIGFSS